MLNYYQLEQGIGISKYLFPDLSPINQKSAEASKDTVYLLDKIDIRKNQCCSLVQQLSQVIDNESFASFRKDSPLNKMSTGYPQWALDRINQRKVYRVNTTHPRWKHRIGLRYSDKKRVHIAGLGDVGSTLLTGLRLLGSDTIESIGIFDLSSQKVQRWLHEGNQIASINYQAYPTINSIDENDLFHCDVFVFCIAKQVPALDATNVDVRMAQLEANAGIVRHYAQLARKHEFDGLFAVVSDPVDQLCQVAYVESNHNEKGEFDGLGLYPEQVKGFGLGVMNARAHFYASSREDLAHFHHEGRVFGPHGKGLVVANSLTDYNPTYSEWLTNQTLKANLVVREIGFKPYIAPALSSGSLSLLATMNGSWHYSTVFINGVYWGCLNRTEHLTQEWEIHDYPQTLYAEIEKTYRQLEAFSWSY